MLTKNRKNRDERITNRIDGSWSEHGLHNVSLCQLVSRLDEKLFKKIKEMYLGETGTLSYSVSLAEG